MAITKAAPTVDTNFDGFETKKFTIAATMKGFRIIVDGLYTNKTRAIIRELSTNAHDAHVEAHRAHIPFEIHLPTLLAPVFRIRDYGCSMDHDTVMNLYSSVFASTKEHTNDYVGSWGLGSKTPLAYTDSLTATAWLGGEKRVYIVSLGSDGVPTITHMHTEKTKEDDGFEVSFPVESKDWSSFQSETWSVLQGFDTKPTVFDGLAVPYQEPVFARNNWRVMKAQPNAIKQGCVIYPITDHQLAVLTNLNSNYGLVIEVPIGTVEVTASREALSFDDNTKDITKELFKVAAEDVRLYVQEQISVAPNILAAEKVYADWRQVIQTNGNVRLLYKHPGAADDDKAVILKGYIEFDHRNKDRNPRLLVNPDGDPMSYRTMHFAIGDIPRMMFIIDRSNLGRRVLRRTARITAYYKEHNNHYVTFGNDSGQRKVYTLRDPSPGELRMLIRRLGLKKDQFIWVGDLPDVAPRKPDSYMKGTRSGVHIWNVNHHTFEKPKTDANGDLEIPKDFYWLPCERAVNTTRYQMKSFGTFVEMSQAAAGYLETIEVTKIKKLPLLWLTPAAQKRLGVEEKNNLDAVFMKYVKDYPNELDELFLRATLFSETQHRFKAPDSMWEEVFGIKPLRSGHTWQRIIPNDHRTKLRTKCSEIAKEAVKKYPLCFSSDILHNGNEVYSQYIKACKKGQVH